jgi:hypothetical protein
MRVLITGNMGYVGPVLVCHLRNVMPSAYIAGFDSGRFAHCPTSNELPERLIDTQHFDDVRVLERHIEESRLDEELSWCVHPTHGLAS